MNGPLKDGRDALKSYGEVLKGDEKELNDTGDALKGDGEE